MGKKTGGAAFPTFAHPDSRDGLGTSGMTLRDYFAAKAMQGLLVDGRWITINWPSALAAKAYEMADAMLAQREKEAG